MPQRFQNTIARTTAVSGVGFFGGADVTLRFCPADDHHGIVFQRVDLPGKPEIPATIEYTAPRFRRTAITDGEAVVEMTEHVLAALTGLQIDNCLVQIDAPEPPGCDGSSLAFAEALLGAGIVEQTSRRKQITLDREYRIHGDDRSSEVAAKPLSRSALTISYHLDYGPRSPVPAGTIAVEISPATFLEELAFARTFVLETEVQALQAQGYGRRVTAKDLLVFSEQGVIDNSLRTPDECVRHKILDCLGDFALIGCDLQGHFSAFRSGHRLNREMIRRIRDTAACRERPPQSRAA